MQSERLSRVGIVYFLGETAPRKGGNQEERISSLKGVDRQTVESGDGGESEVTGRDMVGNGEARP